MELIARLEPTRGMDRLCHPICPSMWSITPYALCDLRCTYCCTGVQGRSEPVADVGDDEEIRGALAEVPDEDLFIVGAFADGYPNVEAELGLTRRVLAALVEAGRRVTVVTKGDTVLRDLDLLVAAGGRVNVQVSICSTDDEALRRMEPDAPSGSRRFEVIATLHQAGVPVDLNALPWIPGVTDTAALLACLPEGVKANFSPLATGWRDERTVLGRRMRRDEVWAAYLDEYHRFGHLPQTSWVEPSLPPEENHPLHRLPRLVQP